MNGMHKIDGKCENYILMKTLKHQKRKRQPTSYSSSIILVKVVANDAVLDGNNLIEHGKITTYCKGFVAIE